MSVEHTVATIDWFKRTFTCDVCIVSGKDEKYPDGFDLPVNYIDWEIENFDLLVEKQLIHVWKHYQICQMLPKRYKNIIRARSDINVMHIEQKYINEMVYYGFQNGYTLGFGNLGADKIMVNFDRRTNGSSIRYLSDYVISHVRDHAINPEGVINMKMNAHIAWTFLFQNRIKMENVLFPITRIEKLDNKQYERVASL
tara:strand:- start:584 stop:1177 length:594 start_codon:yes stop_codon:yes gene_type:complete